MRLLVGLFFGCLLLQGCSQWHYDLGTALTPADVPEQGVSLGEALAQLGPPMRISATDEGYVMAWEHWLIAEHSLGFSLGVAGLDMLSVDWGAAETQGEFILLGFDEEHRLISSAFTRWDNDLGGGQSIQPLGSLVSVVDVDDLVRRMPQHGWGAMSLLPLPVSLNVQSSMDMGHNGLEQRGTPTAVGQHALEMD